MSKDPDYLAQLGELATLKSAIQCYFHQDAFEIYKEHEALIADLWNGHPGDSGDLLRKQLGVVLAYEDTQLEQFWNQHSEWLCASAADTRTLLRMILDGSDNSAAVG